MAIVSRMFFLALLVSPMIWGGTGIMIIYAEEIGFTRSPDVLIIPALITLTLVSLGGVREVGARRRKRTSPDTQSS